MNWFKVHEDYDKLREPWRFLIALYFASPLYVGLAIMDKYPFAAVVGMSFVCFMTLHRILYVARGTR